MDLDARKPVFGGLWTTKSQTSLHIHTVWSAPLLFTLCYRWNLLAGVRSWADWFESRFFGNPKDRFCRDKAHIWRHHLPLEKKTLTAKQKDIVVMAYSIRKTNNTVGLVLPITAPLSVWILKNSNMMSTVMRRKKKYLTNQASQCNQLFIPIIFIDSCNYRC